MRTSFTTVCVLIGGAALASAQNTPTAGLTTGNGPYVPGVTYQSDNPNYLNRNPFYFEGRVDWNLLKITNPSTPFEYTQRGIHEQDDLQDNVSAIADYKKAISLNDLNSGSCQIVTSASQVVPNATLSPAPCMFTPRLRLAHLVIEEQPDEAINLYQEVLKIDSLRLGVNELIGEAYEVKAKAATDEASKTAFFMSAIAAYQAELALSPVTTQYTALTGDTANNAHVHWSLSEIYADLGDTKNQAAELNLYLAATKWHSDTYAWHIQLAKARLAALGAGHATTHHPVDRAK